MKYLSYLALGALLLAAAKSDKKYYNETFRPQVHFSPEKSWLFECNGIVRTGGEYHLFYQDVSISNKVLSNQLGHAVSKDLIHWKHLPAAFTPDEKITDMSSCHPMAGSAVVDSLNITGLQADGKKTMLVFYTDSQGNQNLAFSSDLGMTWKKYQGNPILSNKGEEAHDPRVFYHAKSGKWIMTLYRARGEGINAPGASIYASGDLIHWQFESHVEGAGECPDLFELGYEDKNAARKWVMTSGEGSYRIGNFDGSVFTPETGSVRLDWGKNFFAPQTVSGAPGDKAVQIAWMRGGEYPDMPFNGQLSFPNELFLKQAGNRTVLCRRPVAAIASLYEDKLEKKGKKMIPGINSNLLSGIKGDVLHIKAVLQSLDADTYGIIIRNGNKSNGTDIQYDANKKVLEVNGCKMTLEPVDKKLDLEIIVDRSSVEILSGNGAKGITTCFNPTPGELQLVLYTQGGEIMVESLEAHTLKSAWTTK